MNRELVLAIETSSKRAGAALARDGTVLAVRQITDGAASDAEVRRYDATSAGLLPAIQAMLAEQGLCVGDVGVVAFSQGPGSFTGLRVAATVARMLNAAIGCRVVAVPTLEVIAVNAAGHPQRPERVAVLLDAKRGQVYAAAYGVGATGKENPQISQISQIEGSRATEIQPAAVRDPAVWLASLPRPLWVMGEGVEKHREACVAAGAAIVEPEYWIPRAESVAGIGWRMALAGEFCAPEQIVPLYLRPPECEEVYEQRRAEARARRDK